MVGETLTCTGTPAARLLFAEALHGSSSAGVLGSTGLSPSQQPVPYRRSHQSRCLGADSAGCW